MYMEDGPEAVAPRTEVLQRRLPDERRHEGGQRPAADPHPRGSFAEV